MAKKVTRQPVTKAKFDKALDAYVTANNQYTQWAAERDARVKEIDAEYPFDDLKEEMKECFDVVQTYCEDNRGTLFVDAKSMTVGPAHMGFREGKLKVVLLKGFKEKEIVEKMAESAKWSEYVRNTPSLNKAALIEAQPAGLTKLGLEVVQEESFFLDVNETHENKEG